MYKAIQKIHPTIDLRALSQHSIKSQGDTDRMTKFKTDPFSNKKVLKC